MALANAIKGARRPSQLITWLDGEGDPVNLTGATITGFIQSQQTLATSTITGTLTVSDATAGEFVWEYSADDVANAGKYNVQFVAAFGTGLTPSKSLLDEWEVKAALSVSA